MRADLHTLLIATELFSSGEAPAKVSPAHPPLMIHLSLRCAVVRSPVRCRRGLHLGSSLSVLPVRRSRESAGVKV